MGGFTLTAIGTIITALEYMRKLLILFQTNKELYNTLYSIILEGYSEDTIEKETNKFIDDIIDQTLKEELISQNFSKIINNST